MQMEIPTIVYLLFLQQKLSIMSRLLRESMLETAAVPFPYLIKLASKCYTPGCNSLPDAVVGLGLFPINIPPTIYSSTTAIYNTRYGLSSPAKSISTYMYTKLT